MVPHQEKISLSPGEIIHQENKRISWSPGGLKKVYGTPSGENLLVSWWIDPPGGQENFLVSWLIKKMCATQEILLVSWWIYSPGDKEIFSWWGTIHFFVMDQETKRFFCSPGGLLQQKTRRFSPGGVLLLWAFFLTTKRDSWSPGWFAPSPTLRIGFIL